MEMFSIFFVTRQLDMHHLCFDFDALILWNAQYRFLCEILQWHYKYNKASMRAENISYKTEIKRLCNHIQFRSFHSYFNS